jgi:selenide,water dikinase
MSDPRLTAYTRFSGCGAKLGPAVLEKALCGLSQPSYPGLMADFSGCEDAGLFRLDDETALVQTVDFFPPIVDEPRLFGRIAAANALSDVYAMGGRPITALALVCFPLKALGLDALRAMMEGGLEALTEAGAALLGGHSIEDPEPKLGYSVTGLVHPQKAWRNNSLEEGCLLILTKPLGTGLVNMGLRAGIASPEVVTHSQASMARLNKTSCEILKAHRVVACTDVTGFGLAGHAAEMAQGPACGLRLFIPELRILPGAREFAEMGLVPEGSYRNKEGRLRFVRNADKLRPATLDLVFDPQTSGGLLAALPRSEAIQALEELVAAGVEACIAGETGGPSGVVELVP